MMVTKKESRYNAYMKRTDSGIIVKTVDSLTGVESLIKFTSDKIVLPGEQLGNDPTKENIRPTVKKTNEANHCLNKKKRHSLSKKNPKIITKLSNPRPHLKELHPNIPDFNVYEDNSSSTLDFKNPKVVFVANSKLAKDSVVNLNVPGKLANVCYHGALSENGVVKFKAKSVVKPFTIVIGDYVINVNICHNLTSVKVTQNPDQSINKGSSILENYDKGSGRSVNNVQFTEVIGAAIESKTNETKFDKFTEDCRIQIDDETAVISDSSYGRLEERISKENVDSAPHVDNSNSENVSELLTTGLESNLLETENVVDGESLDKSSSEGNNHIEEYKAKLRPSVDSSVNKLIALSDHSSENVIKSKGLNPDNYKSHIKQNAKSCERCTTLENKSSIRDCLSSVSNSYQFSDDLKRSKIKQSGFTKHSVDGGIDINNLSVHKHLEVKRPIEFDNGHTVEENDDNRPNSRCSNNSVLEIKKKLSEATTSLHKLSSVIESIENLSQRSISEENVGVNNNILEISCESLHTIMQERLNEANSNSSTFFMGSKSDKNDPCNKSNMNTSYTEGANRLKSKNCGYHASECEQTIQAMGEGIVISKETEGSLSADYRTLNIKEQSNGRKDTLSLREFGDINYVIPICKKIEPKNINSMEQASYRFTFDSRRQVQSLTNLSESNTPRMDNDYGSSGTSNGASISCQTKTNQNALSGTQFIHNLQTGEPQGGKIGREFPNKIKRSYTIINDRTQLPIKYNNDNVYSLAAERSYSTCLRYNRELDSGTNLGQESHISNPKANSYSTNSIRTIYIKPDCTSSNNLTIPVQHSSMQMFIDDKSTIQGTNNDASTNPKPSCKEKVSKSNFSQKMKHKLSKLKTHLWNFGTVSNRKESGLIQLSENSKSNELEIASSYNNKAAENEESLGFTGKSESLTDLNDVGLGKNMDHEERESKIYPDLRFIPCKNCSQILSDFEVTSPYRVNSNQNRTNLGLIRDTEKLDANCTMDPSDIFPQYSDVSFKR